MEKFSEDNRNAPMRGVGDDRPVENTIGIQQLPEYNETRN